MELTVVADEENLEKQNENRDETRKTKRHIVEDILKRGERIEVSEAILG